MGTSWADSAWKLILKLRFCSFYYQTIASWYLWLKDSIIYTQHWTAIRKIWVQFQTLVQIFCVTLGKSLNLSKPQYFLHDRSIVKKNPLLVESMQITSEPQSIYVDRSKQRIMIFENWKKVMYCFLYIQSF